MNTKVDMVKRQLEVIPPPPKRRDYIDVPSWQTAWYKWRDERAETIIKLADNLMQRDHLHDRADGCMHGLWQQSTGKMSDRCACGASDLNEAKNLLLNYMRHM